MELTAFKQTPIGKYIGDAQLATIPSNLRGGEKVTFSITNLLILGGLGVGAWYIIPPLFTMIGLALGAIVGAILAGFLVYNVNNIILGLKRISKWIHRQIITAAPFEYLHEGIAQVQKTVQTFRTKKAKMEDLEEQSIIEGAKAEENAKTYSNRIVSLNNKVKNLQVDLNQIVKEKGQDAELDPDYSAKNLELFRASGEAKRTEMKYNQECDMVRKCGVRTKALKKYNKKIAMAEVRMEGYVLDLQATVEVLERDYEFAVNAKQTTEAMRDIMMFKDKTEIKFAIDLVETNISQNMALASSYLKDIDNLTMDSDFDQDTLFVNLDSLANRISTGAETVPSSANYQRESYNLTQEDKTVGGFKGLF